MKIGVIIPDRNDRPKFLANCLRMIEGQTLKPTEIKLVNFEPTSNKPDLTKRYRIGYDYFRNKDFDIIALMENDDWYSPEYLETMVNAWIEKGKPDIFGTDYTIYYHIAIHKYFTMEHYHRSSAMSTLIKPDLNFKWCPDHEVYTDMHLWNAIQNRLTFRPDKHICLGIKHGVGLCGGRNHKTRMDRYVNSDGIDLLCNTMDKESFKFYTKYYGDSH